MWLYQLRLGERVLRNRWLDLRALAMLTLASVVPLFTAFVLVSCIVTWRQGVDVPVGPLFLCLAPPAATLVLVAVELFLTHGHALPTLRPPQSTTRRGPQVLPITDVEPATLRSDSTAARWLAALGQPTSTSGGAHGQRASLASTALTLLVVVQLGLALWYLCMVLIWIAVAAFLDRMGAIPVAVAIGATEPQRTRRRCGPVRSVPTRLCRRLLFLVVQVEQLPLWRACCTCCSAARRACRSAPRAWCTICSRAWAERGRWCAAPLVT